MRSWRALPLGLALLGLAACSSSGGGVLVDAGSLDTPSEDAGVARAADYCESIVDFFCPFYLRCGRIAESDLVSCRQTFLETCNAVYEPRYVALEAAGFLALDSAGLERCEAHLAAVACQEQSLELSGPCAEIWRGKAPPASPCGIDIDGFVCAPGSTCRLDLSFCGTCVTSAATGDSCGVELAACVQPDRCVGGVCLAPAAVGASCAERGCIGGARCVAQICEPRVFALPGQSCDATRRCVYRAACVGGVCVKTGLLGESCSAAAPCASGRCDSASGRCVALATAGESCTKGSECLSARCLGGLCDALVGGCLKP